MPFQYEAFVNPYAASMADEIARSGDAQARAATMIGQAQARATAIKGAAWAGAAQSIGQLPQQLEAQQIATTDRKLKEQQLAMTMEERQAAQAQRVAILGGRLAGVSSSPDVFVDRVQQSVSRGLLPAEMGQHMIAQVQAAGPDGWSALQKQYTDFADSFTTPVKLGKDETLGIPSAAGGFKPLATGISEPLKGAPGDQFFDRPTTPGAPLTPIGSVPNKPIAVNGQIVAPDTATPIGAAIPKQETPAEQAERQAQTLKLTREAAEIDQKLKGTTPLSPKDRAELDLRRAQIALETARNDRMERKEDVSNPRYQGQLEQQYRNLSRAVVNSRSGVLGIEDSKVTAAKHLITMFDANTNKQTGEITIPPQQYQELVTGLATLVNPKGVPTEGQINELKAATAKGDLGKLAQYLTGENFNGTSQEIAKYLRDQVERQGIQAESNREKELDYIRQSRPTDLEPTRAEGIERGLAGLNRMADVGVLPGGRHIGDPVTYQGKSYKIVGYENGHVTLEAVKP